MAGPSGGNPAFSPEVRAAFWRVVGMGASPIASGTPHEHLESLIRGHTPLGGDSETLIAIRDWFESEGSVRSSKPSFANRVAELVIDGVGSRRSETAIWAIGFLSPGLAVDRIRRRWSSGEIESFIDAAIQALNGVSTKVLGPPGPSVRADPWEMSGFSDAALQGGLVGAFAHLEEDWTGPMHGALHPTLSNLIDLTVALISDRFPRLVEGLEAPAMQAEAVRRKLAAGAVSKHRMALTWITNRSSKELIALAIVQVLHAAKQIDRAGGQPAAVEQPGHPPAEELAPEPSGNGADSAEDALRQLVERLGQLEPSACIRWIGELLTNGSRILSVPNEEGRDLATKLEEECTRLAARLFVNHWASDLVAYFQSGLGRGRSRSRVHHQTRVALGIRQLSAERAARFVQVVLEEHRRELTEHRDWRWLSVDWDVSKDREWLEALGTALALSHEELPAWVTQQCRGLPLSAWDAEADPDEFAVAEQAARHWLLVALLAVPRRAEFGRTVPPSAVRALAEAVWDHFRFCGQYLDLYPDRSLATELAARFAVEFGDAADQWILDHARSEGVGPRALWALLEERLRRPQGPVEMNPEYDDIIVREFTHTAVARFGDGAGLDLEPLQFWARLWLCLGAVNQAERTAIAISRHRLPATDRKSRILALRLLSMVVRCRKLTSDANVVGAVFHDQLWPVSTATPSSEEADRRAIEEAFGGPERPSI